MLQADSSGSEPLGDDHLDKDQLAQIALGEPLAWYQSDHLAECEYCTQVLVSLGPVPPASADPQESATGPLESPANLVEEPAEDVAAGLARLRQTRSSARTYDMSPPKIRPQVTRKVSAELSQPSAALTPREPPKAASMAPVKKGRNFGGRSRYRLLGAAIAAVVICLVGGVAVISGLNRSKPPRVKVVQRTDLIAQPAGGAAQGAARVVQTGLGLKLQIHTEKLVDGPKPSDWSGYYEAWLMDANAAKMFSLGALQPDGGGSFDIPTGLNLDTYLRVEISAEPLDGVPAYSGVSMMRGNLSK